MQHKAFGRSYANCMTIAVVLYFGRRFSSIECHASASRDRFRKREHSNLESFRAIDFTVRHRGGAGTRDSGDLDMSTSGNAPLSTSSRRRRGAALAAVALALAGGLAFAVVDTKAATTSLITPQYHEHIAHAAPQEEDTDTPRRRLNSGLHGKVGSIEKWLLIVIIVLGAVCLLCCVCCIIHVGTCGIL